jgi:hypothetical protein
MQIKRGNHKSKLYWIIANIILNLTHIQVEGGGDKYSPILLQGIVIVSFFTKGYGIILTKQLI